MKIAIFLLVILIAFTAVVPAYADEQCRARNCVAERGRNPDRGRKSCEQTPIHLADYLAPEIDGQYTPIEIAYADYLEDFNWWMQRTKNPCRWIRPETL